MNTTSRKEGRNGIESLENCTLVIYNHVESFNWNNNCVKMTTDENLGL